MLSPATFSQYSNDASKLLVSLTPANGRLDLIEPQISMQDQFQFFERSAKINKDTNYRCDGCIQGKEENPLSQSFFSAANIDHLQTQMRHDVYRLSQGKFSIPEQNRDQLYLIMDGMYYQYARFSKTRSVQEQTDELNARVLKYVVPFLYNEAIAYFKYIRDVSTLVEPMARPAKVDRDYKDLAPLSF
jgi:hypothetical protein